MLNAGGLWRFRLAREVGKVVVLIPCCFSLLSYPCVYVGEFGNYFSSNSV